MKEKRLWHDALAFAAGVAMGLLFSPVVAIFIVAALILLVSVLPF